MRDPPVFLLQSSPTWNPALGDGSWQRVQFGAGGQMLAANSDGSVGWTGTPGFTVTQVPFGADPTGNTDSTTAIQAAINAAQQQFSQSLAVFGTNNILNLVPTVFFPPGSYLISSPLHIAGTAAVRLTGAPGSRIFSSASGLIDFQGTFMQQVEIDHLSLDATGGHVFANPNMKFCHFHDLQLLQRSPGFAIWDQEQAGNALQNCAFTDVLYYVCPDPNTGLRTIPAWKIYCDTGAATSEVQWTRVTGFNLANASGNRDNSQFLFDLACTAQGTSSYVTQLAFRDCSFHRCFGGGIRARSTAGLLIDHMTIQDVFNGGGGTGINLNANLISIGTFGTGPPSRAVWVRNYHRGNTAATGSGVDPSDLSVTSDTISVLADGFIMTTTPANDKPQINLNGCAQAVVQAADPAVTILNQNSTAGQATIVLGNGAISVGGTAITVP